MNRDPQYLLDILQYGQDALEFVRGLDEASFAQDIKTQRAVIYCIAVMGEATKKLSPELRSQNPHIPWKDIAGMRDKCVHDYRQIDARLLWLVTQTSIPDLLRSIEALVKP